MCFPSLPGSQDCRGNHGKHGSYGGLWVTSVPRHRMSHMDKTRQAQVLRTFIEVFCHKKHGRPRGELCDECLDLQHYALARMDRCKKDPKPPCKKCTRHSYAPAYRQRIRQVMRYSGMYFVLHGRLHWLLRMFG